MSIGAAVFFGLWRRIMRKARWSNIPILNRIPLPGKAEEKVDDKIQHAIGKVGK